MRESERKRVGERERESGVSSYRVSAILLLAKPLKRCCSVGNRITFLDTDLQPTYLHIMNLEKGFASTELVLS